MAINIDGNSGGPGQGSASIIRLGAYNRLEPSPRSTDFSQSLSVPTADALWMLTRQWQFGEFTGEDAATSILAKVTAEFTQVSRLGWEDQGTYKVQAFDSNIPLEAQIEGEKVPLDWKTNLQVSAYWKKFFKGDTGIAPSLFQVFLDFFTMDESLPIVDKSKWLTSNWERKDVEGDRNLTNQIRLLKNKVFYTIAFMENLIQENGNAANVLRNHAQFQATKLIQPSLPTEIDNNEDKLKAAGENLRDWFLSLYIQPNSSISPMWDTSRMEYRFDLGVPDGSLNNPRIALRSKEYYQGQPDWYAFEVDKTLAPNEKLIKKDLLVGESLVTETKAITLLSSISDFPGMPAARLWAFEDGSINFAQIEANTTDLSTIIMTEFAFLNSQDYRVIPFNVKAGSLSTIKSIIVTDSFGFNTLIESASESPKKAGDEPWNFIGMSQKTSDSNDKYAYNRLFFPPVTFKTHEGTPVEHILFIRDEMANMVWAIEKTVPGLLGIGTDAYQAFLRRKAMMAAQTTTPSDPPATYTYKLLSTIPENWIPFVPSKMPDSDASIRLLRGKTIRNDGDSVKPRGKILSEKDFPHYIFEEEVPREGIQVVRSFQRTRWFDGKVVCWLGRKKMTGKGEGSSGLVFDQLIRNE